MPMPSLCIPLKLKLLASFFTIVVFLLVATAYSVGSAAKQHSMKLLTENMEISQSVVIDHISDTINVIDKAANNLTSDFNVKSLILNANNDQASIRVALNNFANRFDTSEFALTDPQGKALTQSTNFSLTEIDNIKTLANERGVWLAMNDTYYLAIIVAVKNTPLSRNAMAYLIFAKSLGEVFDEDIAKLSSFEVNAVTKTDNNTNALATSGRDAATVVKIFENQKAVSDQIATSEIANEIFFSSTRVIDRLNENVLLMLVTPEDLAFLSNRSLFKDLSFLLLISTILVSVFALYISNNISSPILLLSKLTTKIGQGNNQIDIPQGGTVEVNNLANAMSTMNVQLNKRNKEIQTLAFEDELTQLPNKNSLIKHLEQLLDDEPDKEIALLLVDIAKFTDVNDAIGYQAADCLLQKIAERIRQHLGQAFFVSRMSGNQFAIVNTSNPATLHLITEILDCIHMPFKIDNINIGVNAKIGYAVNDGQISDSRRLAQAAEIALKVAKNSYHAWIKYDPSLILFDARKLNLMTQLADITENGQLSLHYQPQLNLQTNQIDSVECLARWIHPDEGFVPPDLFIGLAEQTGDIKKITRWVVTEALRQHKEWLQTGLALQVSVNISAVDLADDSFVPFILETLAKFNMDASFLMLEVTESTAMEDPEIALRALEKLSNIGIKLSIDDFGTGYSSMAQLKKMPVKELKIDKAFVLELSKSVDDQNMVKTFIALAQNMDLKTVAEGVEDQQSLSLLKGYGCTHGQGYFISRPLDERGVQKWFSETQFKLNEVTTLNV